MILHDDKLSTDSKNILSKDTIMLINNLDQIILVFDTNDQLIEINEFTLKATGFTKEHFFKYYKGILQQEGQEYFVLLPTYDNHPKKIFLKKNEEALSNGIYFLIEQSKQSNNNTKDDLLHVSKELDAFIYRSYHDFKGPIATIQGLLQLVDLEVTDEVAMSYFKMIEQSANRIDTIICSLLELVRIRNSDVDIVQVDLEQITADILKKYLVNGKENDIQLKLQIKNAKVFTSKHLIEAVLDNLIINAIKYRNVSPGFESWVTISITSNDKKFTIIVSDNGIGIPKERLNHIFEIFVKANFYSESKGLGLYIVKTCVDKLMGKIKVESIEGKGSTFKVEIPILPV